MISLDFIRRKLATYGREYGDVVEHCSFAWVNRRKELAKQMMDDCARNPMTNRPAVIKTYLDWSVISDLVFQKEKQQPVLSGLPKEYRIARTKYHEAVADKNEKISTECHRKMDELLSAATPDELNDIELHIHETIHV